MPNDLSAIIPENVTETAQSTPTTPSVPSLGMIVPDFKQTQTDGIKGSLFVAGQTTPDRAAEALKLSKQFRVDPSFARDNLDELKKNDPTNQVDVENITKYYPGVTQFLQDPNNASVSHDDIPSMKAIDKSTRYVSKGYLNDLGTAVSTGFNDFQRSIITMAAAHGLVDKDNAIANLNSLDREAKQLEATQPDYIASFHKALEENKNDLTASMGQFSNTFKDLRNGQIVQGLKDYYQGGFGTIGSVLDLAGTIATNPRALGFTLTEGAVPFAPTIAAGLGTTVSAPVAFGATILAGTPVFIGQYFDKTLKEKNITAAEALNDPDVLSSVRNQADRYGITMGVLNALLPSLGGRFVNAPRVIAPGVRGVLDTGARVAADLGVQTAGLATAQVAAETAANGKPDVAGAFQNALLMLGQSAAFEAAGILKSRIKPREKVTPNVENVFDPATPEAPRGDIVDAVNFTERAPEQKQLPVRRAEYSENPAEAIQQVAKDTKQAVDTIQNLQALDELGQAVKGSKLAKRAPDKIQELVESSGGGGQVFFQSDDWDQYWIKKGLSPEQAAEELGISKSYNDAKAAGKDIEVPLGKYVSGLADTEHYDPLLNFVKTEAEGLKLSEANERVQETPELVNSIAQESEGFDPTVVRDQAKDLADKTYDQLIAAGRPKNEAQAARDILESRFRARADITGFTPQQQFDRYGFEVLSADRQSLGDEPTLTLNQSETGTSADTNPELFQGGKRGSIEFGKYKSLIRLGDNADASTFIHEAFHLWTKEFQDDFKQVSALEDKTPRQQRFLEDAKELADYVGAESVESMTTEQWEKIAESGEEYLREGKAPSNALRKAFARFKTWINYLYRAFRNQNVNLNDKIRSVFDRMIASEDEILNRTREDLNVSATAYMTMQEAARYAEVSAAHAEKAENILRRDELKRQEKIDSVARKEETERIRAQVTDVVNQEPVYQAIALLKNGVQADGSPLPEGSFPFKLSKEAILEQYSPEFAAGLPKGIFDKENGITADLAADLLGFNSGDDLLDALLSAPTKESVIKELTEAGMRELHPELYDPAELSNNATKALHNDKRTEMLNMDLDNLDRRRKSTPEKLAADVVKAAASPSKDEIRDIASRPKYNAEIRQQAEDMIGNTNIKDLKPYQFDRLERKAAKTAADLLAKNDIEGAYKAKKQELLNHELFKAAVKADEQVQKATKRFTKVAKKDEEIAKGRDTDLVNAARALISQYGFGKAESPIEPLRKALAYDPDKAAILIDLITPVSNNAKGYDSLNFQEFQDLAHSFDAIWQLARTEKEFLIRGKKEGYEKVAADISKAADTFAPNLERPGYKRRVSEAEKRNFDLASFLARGRMTESIIDEWDMGSTDGVFSKYLFEPVNDGGEAYRLASTKVSAELETILNDLRPAYKTGKIYSAEIDYEFAHKAELLGALLHVGNDSNFQKLLRGRHWGEFDEVSGELDRSKWDAFFKKKVADGTITKQDLSAVQKIWNLFEKVKPDTQRAHKETYGYYFSEIAADPFTVNFPDGESVTYEGGYVPAKADPYATAKAMSHEQKEDFMRLQTAWSFPQTGKGFTKTRVETFAVPLQLNLSLVNSALDWQLRFTHINPRVNEVARMLKNNSVNASITRIHPHAIKDILDPWLQRAAQQSVTIPSTSKNVDMAARFFRRNTSLALLGFNISTAFQQQSGVILAAVRVSPVELAQSYTSFLVSPKKTTEWVQTKSDFMKFQTGDQLNNINESIHKLTSDPSIGKDIGKFVDNATNYLTRMSQHVVDVTVWTAAYNESISKSGKGELLSVVDERAIRDADRAVRLTQGSGKAEHVSAWTTGTPIQQLFKGFFSFVNMQSNLLYGEFRKAKRQSSRAARYKRYVILTTIGAIGSTLVEQGIQSLVAGKQNDPKEYAKDVLFALAAKGVNWFPVAGGTASGLVYGLSALQATGRPDNINLTIAPITAVGTRAIVGTAKAGISLYKHRDFTGQNVIDVFTLIGLASGLPLTPIAKPIAYTKDVVTRKIQPPSNPVDAVRGLLTGRGARIKK